MLLTDVLLSVDGTINMLSHVMLLTDVLLSVDGQGRHHQWRK